MNTGVEVYTLQNYYILIRIEDGKFYKGSEWSDRNDESEWKEDERGKTGQCQ